MFIIKSDILSMYYIYSPTTAQDYMMASTSIMLKVTYTDIFRKKRSDNINLPCNAVET